MKYFLIEQTLRETGEEECLSGKADYVIICKPEEWPGIQTKLGIEIDLDLDFEENHVTKAEVDIDALTGSFAIPDRLALQGPDHTFSFVLDERGIIFVDAQDHALHYIEKGVNRKKWKFPTLERFLYDFLEGIVDGDLTMLEHYETRLTEIEAQIMNDEAVNVMEHLNRIRGDLLALRAHYEQLLDLGQELNENENGFFDPENLRYFDMFCARIIRLQDFTTNLREISVQVRDLHQTQLSVKQNTIMTILTVATVIFTPLTLIAGWYGMNFKYMPELNWKYSYPVLTLICIVIVIASLIYFKKKKWL